MHTIFVLARFFFFICFIIPSNFFFADILRMQSSDQDKTKIELERLNALDAKIDALANDLRSSIENIERKRRKERIQRSQERRNEQIKEEKKNQQKELKKTNKNNNNDANQNEGQWKDEYYKLTTGSGTTQDEEEIDMDVSWKVCV